MIAGRENIQGFCQREADAKRRRAEAEARRKQLEDRAEPDASKQGEDEAPPQAPDAP